MNSDSICNICTERLGRHHIMGLACPMPNSQEFSKASTFTLEEKTVGLTTDAKARKNIPVYTGFVKYFPRAIAAVAELSRIANEQHHPGSPVHWDKSKSTDEKDALMRHMLDEALDVPVDTDDVLHATKLAWRAMANLERVLS